MNDMKLVQIVNDENFNFIQKYDDENEIFNDDLPSCKYYEQTEFKV